MKYKVKSWITLKQLEEKQKLFRELFPCGAGYLTEEYHNMQPFVSEIEDFNDFYEDALIKEIIENEYVICGDTHQYYAIPMFENGYLVLSMRRWAEVMEKAWALMGWMTRPNFYLRAVCNSDLATEKLPYNCQKELEKDGRF